MRLLKSIILNLSLIGLIFTQVTFDVTYVSSADIGGFEFDITEVQSIELFYTYNGEYDKSEFEITNIYGLRYEYSL